jgi:curli biogenesis system outer membrane secretion channel CsgG
MRGILVNKLAKSGRFRGCERDKKSLSSLEESSQLAGEAQANVFIYKCPKRGKVFHFFLEFLVNFYKICRKRR